MANYYGGGYGSNGKSGRPMTKEQLKAKQKRDAVKSRRRMLNERYDMAADNVRTLRAIRSGAIDPNEYSDIPAIDNRFSSNIQNAKFCRKPVGFLMSLIFLIALALIALAFVPLDVPALTQYTALYQEAEAKAGEPSDDTTPETTDDSAAEAAMLAADRAMNADGDESDDAEATGDAESSEEGDGEAEESAATYYGIKDPVYGWISYIAGLVNFNVDLGETPFYDAQLAKVQTGMEDKIAPYLIQAFPAAILLYAVFALALFIKTFVCWASGDRRIYRHTWVECFIMILLAGIVALGGFACTVDVTGSMDFGAIVDYLIGTFTGTGGFTVGYGLIIMLGLPLVGMILSFFLLTRKLRSRDVMQPVIMYNYNQSRR